MSNNRLYRALGKWAAEAGNDEAKAAPEDQQPSLNDAQQQNNQPMQIAPQAAPLDTKEVIRQNLQVITQAANNMNTAWFGHEAEMDASQQQSLTPQPGAPVAMENKGVVSQPPPPPGQNSPPPKTASLGSQVPTNNWGNWYKDHLRNRIEYSKTITGR